MKQNTKSTRYNMKQNWFAEKILKYSATPGYQKPEPVQDAIKLDSNENHVIPKHLLQDITSGARKMTDVREYPLGGMERLATSIGKFVGVPAKMIGVGNGSDQILDLILGHFASKNTHILTSNPTFTFFEERCKLYQIPVTAVPFSDSMKLNIDDFIAASGKADILYLDSPNNPTGFQFSKVSLQKLIKSFEGLVIIDEAYGQFGNYSISGMTKRMENLIVVNTLSKSFGLAGLRVGYFIANKKFTDVFNRVIQYPYPLSSISIEAAILALEKSEQMYDAINVIKSERQRIIDTLRKYDSFEVFDSKANFVLFDARGIYRRVYKALSEQGIAIRQLGKIGRCEGCLRVTVGTREMNSKFLLAVRDLLK